MALIRILANLILLSLSYARTPPDRIIGGLECDENEHPFLAILYNSDGFFCSGTLLNHEWVLTAAHCNTTDIQIMFGLHNKYVPNDDEQIRVPKEKFWCFGTKTCTQFNQDIMLIRLNSSVNNSEHIAPLSLPSNPPSVGSVCRVMGWGTTTSPEVTYPEAPHCVNIEILHNELCEAAYPYLPWNSNILCAGKLEGDKDSCKGDSGGPLICNGQFQGIVSWGDFPCAEFLQPGVYTKVFDYIDWIQGIMAGNTSMTCPDENC